MKGNASSTWQEFSPINITCSLRSVLLLHILLASQIILLFVLKRHCSLDCHQLAGDFPYHGNLQFDSQFEMFDRSALPLQSYTWTCTVAVWCVYCVYQWWLRGYCSLCCSCTAVCLVARCSQWYCLRDGARLRRQVLRRLRFTALEASSEVSTSARTI